MIFQNLPTVSQVFGILLHFLYGILGNFPNFCSRSRIFRLGGRRRITKHVSKTKNERAPGMFQCDGKNRDCCLQNFDFVKIWEISNIFHISVFCTVEYNSETRQGDEVLVKWIKAMEWRYQEYHFSARARHERGRDRQGSQGEPGKVEDWRRIVPRSERSAMCFGSGLCFGSGQSIFPICFSSGLSRLPGSSGKHMWGNESRRATSRFASKQLMWNQRNDSVTIYFNICAIFTSLSFLFTFCASSF